MLSIDLAANVEQVVLDIVDGMDSEPPQLPFVNFGVVVDHCAVPIVSS